MNQIEGVKSAERSWLAGSRDRLTGRALWNGLRDMLARLTDGTVRLGGAGGLMKH